MGSQYNGAKRGEGAGDFEASFKKLQEVVRMLSEGNLSLQESLSAFEEGMALADRCANILEQAELRVNEVSERARQAGSHAAAELAEPLMLHPDRGDLDLLEIEFERELTIETILPTGLGGDLGDAPKRGRKSGGRGKVESIFDDLDPLFDEND
jgi:exodeoxyribonuclease VII small subunit